MKRPQDWYVEVTDAFRFLSCQHMCDYSIHVPCSKRLYMWQYQAQHHLAICTYTQPNIEQ